MPLPLLQDRTLQLLSMGILYLHGRCMDGSPLIYLDLKKLREMLDDKLIDPDSFASLHNFMAGYISRNMLVPG